jgi:S1-C subfamily serine protease
MVHFRKDAAEQGISETGALEKGLNENELNLLRRAMFTKRREQQAALVRWVLSCSIYLASAFVPSINAQMVSSNALQRVFQLKCGDQLGSAFTIDVNKRQYLVTARHLVAALRDTGKIQLRKDADWFPVSVRVFFPGAKSVDVAVLAPDRVVSPTHSLPTEGNYFLSQDVYFLGFPYGMSIEGKTLNAGFPLPFVKKGLIAAFIDGDAGYQIIFVDGINNPGFSGGPVVYQNSETRALSVLGVVSGYRFQEDRVIQGANETPMSVRSNSGLLVAWSIKAALDLIERNPVGAEIKP